MLHIQCPGCQTATFVQCTCPPETPGHLAGCPYVSLDAQVACPPDSDCCQEDHDHGAAANACPHLSDPSHHEGTPCPEPDSCKIWTSDNRDEHRELRKAGEPVPDCPGGHCHKDLPDCTVCRPLTITFVGVTTLTRVGA